MNTTLSDHSSQSSLFNFVVYTDDARRLEYFQKIVHVVVEQYPCQVLFLLAEEKKDRDHIEVKQQGRITLIEASGKDISRIPYLFFRHLVPGIPIYLLWGQEPFSDDPILPYLEQYCTRLIYDSESCEHLFKMARKLISRKAHLHGDIIDMNWARGAGWRRVLSQTFDCSERLESLQNAKEIRIKFNSHHTMPFHHCETQSYYLQAWLGALFDWKFKESSIDGSSRKLIYSRKEQEEVIIELVAEEREELHPGAIISFECNSFHDHHYLIHRLKDNLHQVRVEITMEVTCELPFAIPLPPSSAGMVLLREILFTPPSDHYLLMMEALAQLDTPYLEEVLR